MDEDAVNRLADLVSDRVFTSMSKFVDVLEDLVRENEALRCKVSHLELAIFGDDGDDDFEYEEVPLNAETVWDWEEPELEDDTEPTFD